MIKFLRGEGADADELRFLRGELRRGAAVELEVFDGPDAKAKFEQKRAADALEGLEDDLFAHVPDMVSKLCRMIKT